MSDKYEGHGGSYVYDPATGERTLIERTGWQKPTPQPTAPVNPAPTAQPQTAS